MKKKIKDIRMKLYPYLNKPNTVILVMLIAPIFGFIDRNFVFFFGLGLALFLLKGSKYDWSRFGIEQKLSKKTVYKSIGIAIGLFLGFSILIDSLLESWLGEYDLSSLEDIRGNLVGYLILMLVMWFFAAFGEEFLFRGYYMKALAERFGNTNKSWIYSGLITSLYFGISHIYQGLIGVVSVFIWSFILSLLFNKNRNNLLLLILIHGIYDSIGITLIYLNMDTIILDSVLKLFEIFLFS